MKVALVVEWLDAWRGGAETSTLQFLHHLMERGVDVHLFTRSRPSPTPGLSVLSINGASMSRTRQSVTFTHRVERQLQSSSFDVIHAISPCRIADIYQPRGGTVAESVERNLALIASAPARHLKRYANRLNFKQRHLLALERRIMGAADRPIVVAISRYVERQLQHHYALPAERIRRIYNGVNPDEASERERMLHRIAIREEFGIANSDCLVLTVAHNFRLKGVQRWMEALALLARRGIDDVSSLIVGKGDAERWHRLASRLRIADRLIFTGPSDRVDALRHAADVLVHPTYYDPCSRVVLESMAAGLPCVTTRWDGASEMIRDGENGFVLEDPNDVECIADRITELRNAERRKRLGEAASAVRERISMARHAEEMLVLYDEVSQRKGGPR